MAKSPQVGEQAPDFELPGTDGPFKLSDHRGKDNVVLVFYPFTFTSVCQGELCSLRDEGPSLLPALARLLADRPATADRTTPRPGA